MLNSFIVGDEVELEVYAEECCELGQINLLINFSHSSDYTIGYIDGISKQLKT